MGNPIDANNQSQYSEQLYKKIAKLLQKGMTTAQIAQELSEPIGKTLALIRETKKNVKVKDVPFHIRNKKVIEEHNALGHTSAYIAKMLNARKSDVQKALMRLGLEDNLEDVSVSVKQLSKEELEAISAASGRPEMGTGCEAGGGKPQSGDVYLQMIARKHKTDKAIAKALGKGINQTRALLDKNGIEYEVWEDRRYSRSEFPVGAEALEEMLYEHTIGEIAEELGMSYAVTRRAVHDFGLSELASTRMRTLLDEDELRGCIEQGMSVTEICDKFGVGYSVVRNNLDEYGLEVPRKERPCALCEDECRKYAEEKKTVSDIVRETGLGQWAVRRSYEKSGVEPYTAPVAYKALLDEHSDELRALVEEGNSLRSISEQLGMSHESIRKALSALGLKPAGHRAPRADVDLDKIASLAREGLSMQKIADELGVSREVVKNRIDKNKELAAVYDAAAEVREKKTAESKRLRADSIRDESELELVRTMAENGASQREICEKTGRGLTAVRSALSHMGINTNAPRRLKIEVSVDVLRAYISIGASADDIAADMGLSKQIVYSRLREAGLSRIVRTRSDVKAAQAAASLSGGNLYKAHVEDGKSIEEIAREAMVDEEAVNRAIELHGIARDGSKEEEPDPVGTLKVRKLDADEIDVVKQMASDDKPASEMARALACSIAEVYIAMGDIELAEIARTHPVGKAGKKPGRAAALLTRGNLVKWHVEEGKSAKEIAEETGLSKYTVYEYLRRAGLGKKGDSPSYKQIAAEKSTEIEAMADAGSSIREIAEVLESTPNRVRMAMKLLGIDGHGSPSHEGKMTYRQLAEEEGGKLSEMVEGGKPVREMAEVLGTTPNRIRMALDYMGLKSSSRLRAGRDGKATYRQLAEEHGKEIEAMANAGKPVREIAEELGTTRERVRQAMGLLGIKANGKKRTVELDEETVCEMLLDGDDVAEVAEELGVSVSVVYAALRKWGRTTVGTRK